MAAGVLLDEAVEAPELGFNGEANAASLPLLPDGLFPEDPEEFSLEEGVEEEGEEEERISKEPALVLAHRSSREERPPALVEEVDEEVVGLEPWVEFVTREEGEMGFMDGVEEFMDGVEGLMERD